MIKYTQIKDQFILDDYDKAKTFSDFMPAVAGVDGIPMWVYFVNRGQCVCSIGINDKNNSITEFMPANKALMNVERLGFRTFIKTADANYELYADKSTQKKLISSNNNLVICDTIKNKFSAEVTYTQLANQNFPALLRRLVLTNISDSVQEVNCTDGLAQIVPYGISDYSLKNVSNLSCAYSNATHSNGLIKYQVEYSTDDHAKVLKNKGANFYRSVSSTNKKPFYIYDPNVIFGDDSALTCAKNLFSQTTQELQSMAQTVIFKMATAFSMYDFSLQPGQSASVYSIIGGVKNDDLLDSVNSIFSDASSFEQKIADSGSVMRVITDKLNCSTSDELFDQYINQSFVDNVLRGGMPIKIDDKKGSYNIQYVFSRKHGDLEREYNWFVIPATKYSGGTGNYRDLCQNRRNDVFIFPFTKDYNIKMFYNLLQLDGYNPLSIEQPVYAPTSAQAVASAFTKYNISQADKQRAMAGLSVGELAEIFPIEFLGEFLGLCKMQYKAKFAEGYWTDHFGYNLELVENYLKMYPDNETNLLFDNSYKYFSSGAKVLPLEKRLVQEDGAYYAYKSLELGGEDCWYKDANSKDVIVSLFTKIVGCSLIKSATLDNECLGIEMEGGKPGWNDAMNGLPGLNSSSVPEAMELYKINAFLIEKSKNIKTFELLQEQEQLLDSLYASVDSACRYNSFLHARESFRTQIYGGISGKKSVVSAAKLVELLTKINNKIASAIIKARQQNNGLFPNFIPYDVTLQGDTFDVDKLVWRKKSISTFLEANAKGLQISELCNPKEVYESVRASGLYDNILKVYKTSESIESQSPMIGRVRTFSPGLYERESCFLHMHYKYLLGLLESGLYNEFYSSIKDGFVCYMNAEVYGRSVLQNSSFIVSSAAHDPKLVGRGFQPRLTGANAEVLSMVIKMFIGDKLFYMDNGSLTFSFDPKLKNYMFKDNAVSFKMFGDTVVTYYNLNNIDTFSDKARITKIELAQNGNKKVINCNKISGDDAVKLREGKYQTIFVTIE